MMDLFGRKKARMERERREAQEAREREIALRVSDIPPQTSDWNTKFSGMLAPQTVRLHYWPAYHSNPYQRSFYGADTEHFTAQASPVDAALADLRASGADTVVCFHLHWLNFLYQAPKADEEPVEDRVETFLSALDSFVAEGGRLLWTVHNLKEHERSEDTLDADVRAHLIAQAHAVFVHGAAASAEVLATYPHATGKVCVIEHGHYLGVYPDAMPRQDARKALELPLSDTVFLSLGWLRRYKGLDTLCAAADRLPDTHLVIAGRALQAEKDEIMEMLTRYARVQVHEGWVKGADIQIYMNAADFAVLPYLASFTSGAALLALSFGVPVIAPRLGAFPEVIEDGVSGLLYDPEDPNGLTEALQRAARMPEGARAEMRYAASQAATSRPWAAARYELFHCLT